MMPEGDTITRTARTLHAALAGRVLTRFDAPRLGQVAAVRPGTRVTGVEAVGKHCLVHLDDGRTLRTHMRMSGSWHLYRPRERWRRTPGAARVVLEVAPTEDAEGWVAVCFSAPVVELTATADVAVAHLGPDLCRADADLDEAVRRFLRSDPGREVGVALLDQTVSAGIGNVYKSEALYVCGLDPFTPVADVTPEEARRLLGTAARLLRANLDTHQRTTVVQGGVAVYGRAGRPCRRCGTLVLRRVHREDGRSSYWCPHCQVKP